MGGGAGSPRYGLGNLTAIADHNKLSQYGWTYRTLCLKA